MIELSKDRIPRLHSSWDAYLKSVLIIVVATAIASFGSSHFGLPDISMIYVLCIMLSAVFYGRGPSLLSAILSVATFDFFFVPPYFTFVIGDTRYLLTFATMFLVGIVISNLTLQIKEQAQTVLERERRTARLYALSREFSINLGTERLVEIAVRHIGDVFRSHVVIWIADDRGQLKIQTPPQTEHDHGLAQWVFEHGRVAGLGTETLPSTSGLYLPLMTPEGTTGVAGIYPFQSNEAFTADQRLLLETFINQTALALERAHLTEKTEQAQVQIETEQLRNSLLSSISHDFRTPLAAITGATSSLLENDQALNEEGRHELAQLALDAAQNLNRLVVNILEVTRLESGGIRVNKEWQMLEEVVGTVFQQLGGPSADHPVAVHLPDDLPPVPMDAVLIGQVLTNLLENAMKYTPPKTPIDISAYVEENSIIVEVADRGSGLRPGDETRIFEKFYRAHPAESIGVGLGLTICRGIVEAHGGRIWAENRPKGGVVFRFTLPLGKLPLLLDE